MMKGKCVVSNDVKVLVLAARSMVVWDTVAALLPILNKAESPIQTVALFAPAQQADLPTMQVPDDHHHHH